VNSETHTITHPILEEVSRRPTSTSRTWIAKGAAAGACVAVLANLAVFLVGNLGAPIRVVTGWAPDGADVRISEVIITTIVSVLAGAAALWVLERRRANGFRIWVVVAAAVAIASAVPLFGLDVDAGSKIALSTMHILTGSAVIAAQAFARRSTN
jgi:Family of unknown function (DUF6069)